MIKLKNIAIDNYINYLFVLYAFLLPISRGGISVLTALLFVLWLFSNDFRKKIDFIKSNRAIFYLLAFISFNILSLLWSENISSGIYYIRKYWYFILVLVIATAIEKKYLIHAISAFLAGMLLSEVISYGVFFELWSFKNATVDFPTPFINHIQYSMFLAFTSLLLLNKIFYEENVKIKIFYSVFFLTTTINLFVNAGRTGQAAFAVSIFLVGFLNIKNRVLAFFGILFLILSLFYTSYQLSPNFKKRVDIGISNIEELINKKDYCTSIGLRFGAWSIGSEIFLNNPILGIGITSEMDSLKESILVNHPDMHCVAKMPSYHNFYIQVAVHLGIAGLFLYLMLFYSILKLDIRDKYYFNMMIVFVSVYSISSLVETMFHEQFSAAFLAFFAGIFIAQHRIENEV
ncbi:MAG: O-antigen ligase family protein [Sulfurimonas sp.]|uniref:O-antigen ligase family protein n=1 Tax=Sulfurimonas sp. TaxID=2022749 RepID=UPI0026097040|nr:O-antigen ligase family protein [Sulfurimonas sp.]MDD5401285.1 O-antigen ligase family protein [Sulfurimonas sp.]